jgi:hypothetical protein
VRPPAVGPLDAPMADQARTLIALRKSNSSYKSLLDRAALAADASLRASSRYEQVDIDVANAWQRQENGGVGEATGSAALRPPSSTSWSMTTVRRSISFAGPSPKASTIIASICIPTFRYHDLTNLLRVLRVVDFDQAAYEILIIDNANDTVAKIDFYNTTRLEPNISVLHSFSARRIARKKCWYGSCPWSVCSFHRRRYRTDTDVASRNRRRL